MENTPRVLLIDIETAPSVGLFWDRMWDTQIIKQTKYWHLLTFSAKWLGGKQITKGLNDYKGYRPGSDNDKRMLQEIHGLLDEADIVIAQNGDKFDIRKINARLIYHGMLPPSPFKTIDTKKVASKYFAFNSNSQDWMLQYLGLGKKEETGGFQLWLDCEAGKNAAWKRMKSYNAHDVLGLEKLYLKFRPWVRTHPNIGMYTDKIVCPNCGSGKLQSRGFAVTKTMKYKRLHCQDCGSWSRLTRPEERDKPLVSVS